MFQTTNQLIRPHDVSAIMDEPRKNLDNLCSLPSGTQT